MIKSLQRKRILKFVTIVLISFTLVLVILDNKIYKKNIAQWCILEGPSKICREDTSWIKIFYNEVNVPVFLNLDLHGISFDGLYIGFFSECISKKINQKDGWEIVSFKTDKMKDLSEIFAVVYLSKNGEWGGRLKSANSIPLKLYQCREKEDNIINYDMFETPSIFTRNNVDKNRNNKIKNLLIIFHCLTCFCLLAIVVFYALKSDYKKNNFEPYFWSSVLIVFIFTGFLSIPNIRMVITEIFRDFAKHMDFYSSRRVLQGLLTLIIISLSAGLIKLFLYFIKGKYWTYHCIFIGTSIFTVITILRLLSFHTLDYVFYLTFFEVSVWLTVSFLCLISVLVGVLFYIKRHLKRIDLNDIISR